MRHAYVTQITYALNLAKYRNFFTFNQLRQYSTVLVQFEIPR